ncbi:MAG: DUF2807 domain-containing protein [Polaribacter sp.]|nr:DUF2807 domain-containing protein [Polaribacter sp.]
MKKTLLILIISLTHSIHSQTVVKKVLGDYSILKVYNGIEVLLLQSKEQKIEIKGEKSEKVKIKNVNGVLKLSLPFSLKPENNYGKGKVFITLYYNSNIDVIDANEGSIITGKEFHQEKLKVNSQERAFIDLTLKVTHLNIRASSGGVIKLTGSSESQTVNIDLYGVYNGFGLNVTGNTNVFSGTGAKAEISAGKTLSAKVNFGGSIFYKGSPEVQKNKKVLGGIIQRRK